MPYGRVYVESEYLRSENYRNREAEAAVQDLQRFILYEILGVVEFRRRLGRYALELETIARSFSVEGVFFGDNQRLLSRLGSLIDGLGAPQMPSFFGGGIFSGTSDSYTTPLVTAGIGIAAVGAVRLSFAQTLYQQPRNLVSFSQVILRRRFDGDVNLLGQGRTINDGIRFTPNGGDVNIPFQRTGGGDVNIPFQRSGGGDVNIPFQRPGGGDVNIPFRRNFT